MVREPMTVLGGRLRTSSLVLVLLFAGLLVLYAVVRPEPTPTPVHTSNNGPVPTQGGPSQQPLPTKSAP